MRYMTNQIYINSIFLTGTEKSCFSVPSQNWHLSVIRFYSSIGNPLSVGIIIALTKYRHSFAIYSRSATTIKCIA